MQIEGPSQCQSIQWNPNSQWQMQKWNYPCLNELLLRKLVWQWLLKGFRCPPILNISPNSQVTNFLSLPLTIKYPNSLLPKASNGHKKQNMLLKTCKMKWAACYLYMSDALPMPIISSPPPWRFSLFFPLTSKFP